MLTSFTTYSTNPYKSQTNWVFLRKYNTILSTKTNQTNRREKKLPIQLLPDQVELSYNTSKKARHWFVLIELRMIHLVTLLVKQIRMTR